MVGISVFACPTRVQCPNCHNKSNGKTGKDNTIGIAIYSLGVGLSAFDLMFLNGRVKILYNEITVRIFHQYLDAAFGIGQPGAAFA